MRRKSVLMALGILVLAGLAVVGVLAVMARQVPEFYERARPPAGQQRQRQSKAFYTEVGRLLGQIDSRLPVWGATFTEAQLNSYFEEDFLTHHLAEKLLPESVKAPRVVIEQDKIRLAFRYGTPPWSTVISLDLRIWLAPKERNVVVLELQSLHAGSLPISAQSLLEQLSEMIRKRNIDVTWYRHNGNPAAVLRFQNDQARPSFLLRKLELRNGTLTVVGSSIKPANPHHTPAPACPTKAPLGN
ncbi:MAG: hypothetical protein L0Z62_10380 [Gemmataceae bacterium]|nr:hypothetical protein [Gemmataceae bacterium]